MAAVFFMTHFWIFPLISHSLYNYKKIIIIDLYIFNKKVNKIEIKQYNK